MDSKLTETPIATDSPRSVAIPSNIEGLNDSNMCDLNKVFQINFTYNVDLLKSLLEGILKFQKSAEEELEEEDIKELLKKYDSEEDNDKKKKIKENKEDEEYIKNLKQNLTLKQTTIDHFFTFKS